MYFLVWFLFLCYFAIHYKHYVYLPDFISNIHSYIFLFLPDFCLSCLVYSLFSGLFIFLFVCSIFFLFQRFSFAFNLFFLITRRTLPTYYYFKESWVSVSFSIREWNGLTFNALQVYIDCKYNMGTALKFCKSITKMK